MKRADKSDAQKKRHADRFDHFRIICFTLLWNDVGPGGDAATCKRAEKHRALQSAMTEVLKDPVLGPAIRERFCSSFVGIGEIKEMCNEIE